MGSWDRDRSNCCSDAGIVFAVIRRVSYKGTYIYSGEGAGADYHGLISIKIRLVGTEKEITEEDDLLPSKLG